MLCFALVADELSMFARVIETQAIAAEIIEHFKFELPDDRPEILRTPMFVMGPMIKGKLHEGVQMPLRVTCIHDAL